MANSIVPSARRLRSTGPVQQAELLPPTRKRARRHEPAVNADEADPSEDGSSISWATPSLDVTPSTSANSGNAYNYFIPCEPSVSHVREQLVADIRMGRLIDLWKLLRKDGHRNSDEQVLTLKDGVVVTTEHKIEVNSFYKWFDAFIIYMSIWGRYYPNEFQGMLRHVEIVKQTFSDHNDGALYDHRFRSMKADTPQLPWGQFMAELIRPMKPTATNKPKSFGTGSKSTVERKTKAPCNYFNYGKCSRKSCHFAHACLTCSKPGHNMSQCSSKIKSS